MHDVGGARYAGPDAGDLHSAEYVHSTCSPVITPAECKMIRTEAGAAMAVGRTSDFTYTEAARIGEVHVADLTVSRWWLQKKLETVLLPLVSARFGVPAASLRVYDALVLRYDAAREARRQPMHRDAALVSLNIALSDASEYEGGGTLFEGSGRVVSLSQGQLACHASGVRHAGATITSGVRWVLVVFLISKDLPQLGRRCAEIAASHHADAAEALHANDGAGAAASMDEAQAFLEAGLSVDPADYQLHHGQAGLHLLRGEAAKARRAYLTAATLNPACPRPRGALGSVLRADGRHRGALRHFEAARALAATSASAAPTKDADDRAGEVKGSAHEDEGAREAALCAAECVVELLAAPRTAASPVARGALHRAIGWVRSALEAAPSEARATDLLRRMEALA